jgi:hypothetical protein
MEYVALELGPWAEHLQELVVVAVEILTCICLQLVPSM